MFVNPLHRARLGSGIALAEVTARTCLSPRIVQLIDSGQFDRLPGGLYARSYVRAFASVVGLNPEEVIRELGDRLPPEEDPLPALRENAREDMPPLVRDLTRWADAVRSALGRALTGIEPAALVTGQQPRRMAAAGVDLALMFLGYALLMRLTAWVAGVDLQTGVEFAGIQVAAVSGILGLLYFLLLGGIGGRTPGTVVVGLPTLPHSAPLKLRDILNRACPGSRSAGAGASSWHDTHHLDPADSTI